MVFRRSFLVVMIILLGLAAIMASFQLDQPLQQRVLAANQGHWSHDPAAAAASKYGDWPELMLLGGLGFLLARQRRNYRWKRILLCAMIASTLAGMAVNLSRLTTGRTRPRAAAEQGWYGPYHDGKWLIGRADFNSFPSGHTATAVGFAGVILFAAPAWGIPAMIAALAVALSRILLGAHHPSDVVTAAVVALATAWAVWEFLGKHCGCDRTVPGAN
jgi:membrane-associated phospholipid phosphatase